VTPDRPYRAVLRPPSVTVVAPFGGWLRKIDFTSRVQARCLRKHGFPPCFQDRVLTLASLACSGLPNALVSDPSTGVRFRSTSRRRAYRNSTSLMVICVSRLFTFRSTSRRRAYRKRYRRAPAAVQPPRPTRSHDAERTDDLPTYRLDLMHWEPTLWARRGIKISWLGRLMSTADPMRDRSRWSSRSPGIRHVAWRSHPSPELRPGHPVRAYR
jgi:hypothetical protein